MCVVFASVERISPSGQNKKWIGNLQAFFDIRKALILGFLAMNVMACTAQQAQTIKDVETIVTAFD